MRRAIQVSLIAVVVVASAIATNAVASSADGEPKRVPIPRAVRAAIRSAFVVKLRTPIDDQTVRVSQGAGALLRDGRIVSALHVFVDPARSVRGQSWGLLPEETIRDAEFTFTTDDGGEVRPLAAGSKHRYWASDDLIVIEPTDRIARGGVRLAATPVQPNDRVTFVGLSENRGGEFVVLRSHVTIRATSSPHFFVFGNSVPGDSGGPIFNDRGELVGLIISSGEHGTAIDVQTDMTRPDKKVIISQTRAPGIIAVDVVKLLRGESP